MSGRGEASDRKVPTLPRFYASPFFVPAWGWGELRATARCLATGRIVRGGEPARLAREVQALLGVRHAVPVNQGRVAILLALRALGTGEQDEVVLPSYLCRSVLDAVRAAGARPVLADAGAGLHVTAESVRRALTPATRCVIVPHLYGNVAPVDAIENELRGTGIALIDDAAQSFGARCGGRRVGSFGRCGIVSTSLGKSLSGAAGGLLVTDDAGLFERAIALRLGVERPGSVARRALAAWVWFRLRRFTLPLKRRSDRLFSRNQASRTTAGAMSNLDAAIALQQCRSLEHRASSRRHRARRVLDALGDARRHCISDLSDSCVPLGLVFLLPPAARPAEEATLQLARAGIEVRRGYAPLHHELGIPPGAFPNAEALWRRAILVPLSRTLEARGASNALRDVLRD